MNKILNELKTIGFTIDGDRVTFDGMEFAYLSSRERGDLNCYPFVVWVDDDETYLDTNDTIFASDSFYSYYEEFFDKYDNLFNKNKNGSRFKLNSTSNDEVNLCSFLKDILTIYLRIRRDVTIEMIDNF